MGINYWDIDYLDNTAINDFDSNFNLVENSYFKNLVTFNITVVKGRVTDILKNFHKVITNRY